MQHSNYTVLIVFIDLSLHRLTVVMIAMMVAVIDMMMSLIVVTVETAGCLTATFAVPIL